MKTVKPMPGPIYLLESISGGTHPPFTEQEVKRMFNFTNPDEKTVEYYIQETDGIFVIFSKAYPIHRDGHGVAHNFVAERAHREDAEELISKLKRLP